MSLLYNFDVERPEELLAILAQNLQKRRLEKGLSEKLLPNLAEFRRLLLPSLNKSILFHWHPM